MCMRFPKSTIVSQFSLTGSGRWSACHCSNCEVNFGKLNVLERVKTVSSEARVRCMEERGRTSMLLMSFWFLRPLRKFADSGPL